MAEGCSLDQILFRLLISHLITKSLYDEHDPRTTEHPSEKKKVNSSLGDN